MKREKMKKLILNVGIPMVAILCTSVASYAFTQNNLLPRSQTKVIEAPTSIIENTINISQIKTLEGLEGVSNLFYYNGEEEIVIGMNKERQKAINEKIEGHEYYRNIYGDIYKVNINKKEVNAVTHNEVQLNSLDAEFGAGYSPNGKYVDAVEDGSQFIYDIAAGTRSEYSNQELIGNWTKNGNAMIKYGVVEQDDIKVKKFFVYDTKGKLVSERALHDDVDYVQVSTDFYSDHGEEIYFIGRMRNKEQLNVGLYKLNMKTGDIEDIISVPSLRKETIKNPGTDMKEHPGEFLEVGLQSSLYDFEFLSQNRIVFSGMVDHESGLYLYNTKEKKIKMLLASEGGLSYKVAPDESKIVYTIDEPIRDHKVQKDTKEGSTGDIKALDNDTNIFVANISQDGLENITYVKKDTLGTAFKWSNDSKKLIFFQAAEGMIGQVSFE